MPACHQDRRLRNKHLPPLLTLPPDILILIVKALSEFHEIYAPLICSHVCHRWRVVILDAPSLWTYIDTSRGEKLTRLWLSNAKGAALDVYLRELTPPKQIMGDVPLYLVDPSSPLSTVEIAIREAKQQTFRWRSLNIALRSISSTSEIIKSLGDLPETLPLDCLSIDPIDQTLLVIDDGTVPAHVDGQISLADATTTRSLFQRMNVQPAMLRINTYPIAFSPVVFSSRLTVLEGFSGSHYTHPPNINEWHQILSHTPQLVQLRLWNSRHIRSFGPVDSSTLPPLQLPSLKYLELSGAFTVLSPLFTKFPLPELECLLLDCLGTHIYIPKQLSEFASVCPSLAQLHVGSACFNPKSTGRMWWTRAFQQMRSLRALKFFEVEWREVELALLQLSSVSHSVVHIELDRIWDINMSTLGQLLAPGAGLPRVKFTDCADGQDGRCTKPEHTFMCESDSGSNYSDDASFTSGQDESSTDSEMSDGEDEGSDMGKAQR
ncbi:hypothetical protein FRC09_012225 [Ceratobasidium sp. 395]|nr:hypothetical protein FRC09_012225 [Ceratobasidium sp. 395]